VTFEQLKDAAEAMLKGDPDVWGVTRTGIKQKLQEFLPGTKD
jgi:pyruvate dehydrogenase (quinone)